MASADDLAWDEAEDGPQSQEFRDFAGRLTGGGNDAAEQLLARYSARLVRLARQRLGPRLGVKADPEEVVQSVMRTFFRRLGAGEFELRDWASLSGLLSVLTLRKCQRHAERNFAGCRDIRRETPIGEALTVPDREPTPEEAAVFADLLERLLAGLDARDQSVLDGLLSGESVGDIADRLNCSTKTVRRTLARIRLRLLALPDFAPPGN